MRYLVAALLALAACNNTPTYCKTRCGLELKVPGDCAALQAQEDVVLTLYSNDGFWSTDEMCDAFSGYAVDVAKDADSAGVFVGPDGMGHVGGYCDCDNAYIKVGNQKWHDPSNAISHELIHAIQKCEWTQLPDGGIDQHYQWRERGYLEAIANAQGYSY